MVHFNNGFSKLTVKKARHTDESPLPERESTKEMRFLQKQKLVGPERPCSFVFEEGGEMVQSDLTSFLGKFRNVF